MKKTTAFVTIAALLAACTLVIVLALQKRQLSNALRLAMQDLKTAYRGFYVPETHVHDIDGADLVVGGLRPSAKQLVIYFSTTCPYCRASVGVWRSMADRLTAGGLGRAVALRVDSASDSTSRVFFGTRAVEVAPLADQRTAAIIHASAVPQTIVLDSVGRVAFAHAGLMTSAVADSILRLFDVTHVSSGERDSTNQK